MPASFYWIYALRLAQTLSQTTSAQRHIKTETCLCFTKRF
ncbi:hypothetical protein HMPREF1583_01029 [Gardnerella vaginalis JCP8151B]|nr:hypothetical protein HMPREF1583_01029 [Gardnerella vaginalis JCP8151B]